MRIKFIGEAPLDAEGEVGGKALSFHLNPGYVYDLTPEQVTVLRKLGQDKFVQPLRFVSPDQPIDFRPVPGSKTEPAKPKAHEPESKPDVVPELPKMEPASHSSVLPTDPFPPNDSSVWKPKGKDKKPR